MTKVFYDRMDRVFQAGILTAVLSAHGVSPLTQRD
jgi:hypothetical protein